MFSLQRWLYCGKQQKELNKSSSPLDDTKGVKLQSPPCASPLLFMRLQNILVVLNIPQIGEIIWKSGWI